MPTEATIKSNSNKLPTLTAGTKVEPDVQTTMTFSCFRDQHIINWLSALKNAARLSDMPFSNFQLEFKRKLLHIDWEQRTRAEILVSRMKDTEIFSEFSTNVIALNSLLLETKAHLNDTRIRHTLEAGMIKSLQFIYNKDKAANAIDADELDAWINVVNSIDEDRAHLLATAHSCRQETLCQILTQSQYRTLECRRWPIQLGTPFVGKKCPKLTDDERKLLIENDGCTVCRCVFVGHDHTTCTNGFPSGENYVPVTADTIATTAAARSANKGKAKPIAIVMNPVEDSDDSNDTDPDLSVSPCLHHALHFFWDCLIEGPMSNLPLEIRGPMDDSAFLALIDTDLTDGLGL
ncbi:hypothetical protein DFH07DRAFT_968087 [Mycena maculata]|uniref:Uncharacterized protein n=1 Tax=Mycena maculata TaxID=230809 RepID=A0AAD7I1V3_9AGAR|nr:hypothetical protein DFH07DRAFT_968087 [Mycena maculata]